MSLKSNQNRQKFNKIKIDASEISNVLSVQHIIILERLQSGSYTNAGVLISNDYICLRQTAQHQASLCNVRKFDEKIATDNWNHLLFIASLK